MENLLTFERVVLESIAKGNKLLNTIQTDVGLELSLVLSIVSKLLRKGLIMKTGSSYELLHNDIAWKKVSKIEGQREEVNEITESLVDLFFNKGGAHLKLQKVYLSKSDEKIFNALLYNVESFINGITKDQRERGEKIHSKDKKIVMWGHTTYEKILNNLQSAS